MEVFDRKKWTLSTLISDVKNGIISKSQAVLWANGYADKGFFGEAEIAALEAATAEPEAEKIGETAE